MFTSFPKCLDQRPFALRLYWECVHRRRVRCQQMADLVPKHDQHVQAIVIN